MNKRQTGLVILAIIFFIYGFYMIIAMPNSLSKELAGGYISILITYTVFAVISLYVCNRSDFDIFEPIVILLIMYFGIFVYRPMQDIINNDYFTFGENVMGGCIRANVVVSVSIISLCAGYYKKYSWGGSKNKRCSEDDSCKIIETSRTDIVLIAQIIWWISTAFLLLYLITSGKNLAYIFSLGKSGLASDDTTSGSAALTFFAYSMLAPWMYICVYGKSKGYKILLTLLMAIIYVVRGTRIVLLIMISAPILYYYTIRKKRPKMKVILIGVVLILFFMSFMQFVRHGLRTGTSTDFTEFSSSAFSNVFDADLTTYKQFYAIVEKYPAQYEYTFGKAMIVQTLVTMIPRAVWPNKPGVVIEEVIANAVNTRAASAGMASPGIGEYYFEFGIIGCIVCMFILGMIFRKCKEILEKSNTIDNAIRYSVLYGLVFQLIIRTSTASCVYQYLFTILPIYLITHLRIKKHDC